MTHKTGQFAQAHQLKRTAICNWRPVLSMVLVILPKLDKPAILWGLLKIGVLNTLKASARN